MWSVRTRLSAVASVLTVLGAAGPLSADNPWFWSGPARGRGGVKIVIGPPRPAHPPRPARPPQVCEPVDEAPCQLEVSAYQTRDTVIVVASGANKAGGYVTTFSACDTRGRTPSLTLRNTPPAHCGTQVITPFDVTGSFRSRQRVHHITVSIAGQTRTVRVTQVPSLP